jgi:hypothetical protein
MVTDPSTTPRTRAGQAWFGAAVATAYGVLMALHIVFGLFFALTAVCMGRYVWLALKTLAAPRFEAVAVEAQA